MARSDANPLITGDRRPARLRFRPGWRIITGLALAGLALYLAHQPILLAIGDFLVVENELAPADMIHVLSGGLDRLDYGAELYRRDIAPKLFITGKRVAGESIKAYIDCPGDDYLVCRGVDPADIIEAGTVATSTYEEAVGLRQFLAGESGATIQAVLIVSDPYHMRRAQWVFNRVVGDRVTLRFAPLPMGYGRYACYQRRWWTDKTSRQMVSAEYPKLLYYFWKYRF